MLSTVELPYGPTSVKTVAAAVATVPGNGCGARVLGTDGGVLETGDTLLGFEGSVTDGLTAVELETVVAE